MFREILPSKLGLDGSVLQMAHFGISQKESAPSF
jgi:hypothetical protein